MSRAPELYTELKMDQLFHKNNRSLLQVTDPWKDYEGATKAIKITKLLNYYAVSKTQHTLVYFMWAFISCYV